MLKNFYWDLKNCSLLQYFLKQLVPPLPPLQKKILCFPPPLLGTAKKNSPSLLYKGRRTL